MSCRFQTVELMARQGHKIVFRTDASVEIGSGHLMRCLTLADQLRSDGAEVAFICRDLPGGMFDLLETRGYRNVRLHCAPTGAASRHEDPSETIEAVARMFHDGVDWLVVDQYELDAEWERQLRPASRKLMVIDDLANRPHDCDLLLDQNYYRDMDMRYRGLVPEHCVTLLGPDYVLLRPDFMLARQRLRERDGAVRRILVCFGGSDPTNETEKVVEAIRLLERPDIEVDVVVGLANPKREAIRALCDALPNVNFHCQVSNMAELISNADLGVGAGGAAMWERLYLGLPAITVVSASNQERTTKDVSATGAIEYLGLSAQLGPAEHAHALGEMISNAQRTRRIGALALRVLQADRKPVASTMLRILEEPEPLHSGSRTPCRSAGT
jgi:UDP-2,4-diacetamido-2,4,6-trideoxy-beta-L-altropyranose hydrolase